METERNPLMIQSVSKALTVLRAFGDAAPAMGLTDIARATGLEKSAVQRIVATLAAEGMLLRDPQTRLYRVSAQALRLANAHYLANPTTSQAMPRLIDLSQSLRETINLAELDGEHILYSLRLPVKRTNYSATLIGRTAPALNTSGGRAILAGRAPETYRAAAETWALARFTPRTTTDRGRILALIEQARDDGYAVSRDELLLNEIGVAAAVSSVSGATTAAIHCSVSAAEWTPERIRDELAPALMDAARSFLVPG